MGKEKASDLLGAAAESTVNRDQPPEEPIQTIEPAELAGFTVRLPKPQKEALERYLWIARGEKLAAGARRIIVEWMRAHDIG